MYYFFYLIVLTNPMCIIQKNFNLPVGVYDSPEQETAPGTFFLLHPLDILNLRNRVTEASYDKWFVPSQLLVMKNILFQHTIIHSLFLFIIFTSEPYMGPPKVEENSTLQAVSNSDIKTTKMSTEDSSYVPQCSDLQSSIGGSSAGCLEFQSSGTPATPTPVQYSPPPSTPFQVDAQFQGFIGAELLYI